MENIYLKINNKIKNSLRIAIIAHRFPDGDTIGSITAFYEVLKINFPEKKIDIVSFDPILSNLKFIPFTNKILKKPKNKHYDLFIFLDLANLSRSGFYNENDFIGKRPFIVNIDHHNSNDFYGDLNFVDIKETSTTMILYKFFKNMKYKLNSAIATSLLAGIYTDSGSFKNPNTYSDTFFIAADLIKAGGDLQAVTTNLFFNNDIKFLKLFTKVLDRLIITKNKFALTYITKKDIIDGGHHYEEFDGIVWRLGLISEIKYSLFLYEKQNLVKGSFRTGRKDVDLSKIAGKFGGGGHKKAAAFTIEGKLIFKNSKIGAQKKDKSIIYFN